MASWSPYKICRMVIIMVIINDELPYDLQGKGIVINN